MDPALPKETGSFEKKALSTPVDKSQTVNTKPDSNQDDKKIFQSLRGNGSGDVGECSGISAPQPDPDVNTKGSRSSRHRFGVLAKVVKYVKIRYLQGETNALTLDEILDKINEADVENNIKDWLRGKALLKNPKIEITDDGKLLFKPPYKLKNCKSLLKLLKKHDIRGLGGVFLEDVRESLPECNKALKTLQDQKKIIVITRPLDKKKVLYYNDKTAKLPLDDDIKKLWQSIPVEAQADVKIEEHLNKQGIRSMQYQEPRKFKTTKRKRAAKKKVNSQIRNNEHVADLLETYENEPSTSAK